MAKIGEGDARWLVKAREDGKNVGNWHWSETNCLRFAEDGLRERLVGLQIVEQDDLTCAVTELKSCEGDCYTYNRKGKMYLFHDMHMKLGWKAQIPGQMGSEIEGTIELPNVSEDINTEDLELSVSVSTTPTKPHAETTRNAIRTQSRGLLQSVIISFMDDIKSKISSKQPQQQQPPPSQQNPTPSSEPSSKSENAASQQQQTKPPSTTESVELRLSFDCSPDSVYEALTNPLRVMGYTGAPAVIDCRVGGKFELFGGAIKGEYKVLVPGERIEMTWQMNSWEHDSSVVIKFSGGKRTSLVLSHTGFPLRDKNGNEVRGMVENGWMNNIFNRMKGAFGWTFTSE